MSPPIARVITFIAHKQSIDTMKLLLLALALLSSATAAPNKAPLLALRGGSKPADKVIVEKKKNRPSLLAALPTFIDMPALPKPTFALDKWADAALAGLGLAGSFALLDVIGAKFGVKLVVPPMMASGIIFFSPATPPSPRGFLGDTVGCATLCAGVLGMLNGVSPVVAQGAAAASLLVWYKALGIVFPPAAVLCVLMAGADSPYMFVGKTWLAGHAGLYASALGVAKIRQSTRRAFGERRLASLGALSDSDLKKVFTTFDTSGDGSIDATELRLAIKAAIGVELSPADCTKLVQKYDMDGTETLDFGEFKDICKSKTK